MSQLVNLDGWIAPLKHRYRARSRLDGIKLIPRTTQTFIARQTGQLIGAIGTQELNEKISPCEVGLKGLCELLIVGCRSGVGRN
jgi:hypothetical protein